MDARLRLERRIQQDHERAGGTGDQPEDVQRAKWELFQSIYPTQAEALAQYEKVAIKPEFRWSWNNHQFEHDIYNRYTDKRNDANRAAVRDLLLVGANHFMSMLDAFTTARLQVRRRTRRRDANRRERALVSQITGKRSVQLL